MKKTRLLICGIIAAAATIALLAFGNLSLANAQTLIVEEETSQPCFNTFTINNSPFLPTIYFHRCSDCTSYPVLEGSDPGHCIPTTNPEIQ